MVLHREWLGKWLSGNDIECLFSKYGEWNKLNKDDINLNIFKSNRFSFRESIKYININGFEVPEPLKLHPDVGEEYYCINLLNTDLFGRWIWAGDEYDVKLLMRGFCHSTKEAAILHSKALLSFTATNNDNSNTDNLIDTRGVNVNQN